MPNMRKKRKKNEEECQCDFEEIIYYPNGKDFEEWIDKVVKPYRENWELRDLHNQNKVIIENLKEHYNIRW